MLTPEMLKNVDLWKIATEGILNPDSCTPLTDLQRHQVIRQLIGHEVQSLIRSTEKNLIENGVQSVDDLRRLPYNVVRFDEPLSTYNQKMKTFLYENLYYHYRVMRMTFKAEKIITELFQSYKSKPEILPAHITENIQQYGLERTICDYIAGMTDRFAIDEYQKIFDPTFIP
jgi:dGTPase